MASTSLLSDFALYLATNSTSLTIGQTLFYLQLPATTSNPNVSSTVPVAAIVPQIGLQSVRRFSQTGAGAAFERPTFKIVVRSTDGGGGDPSPLNAWQLANEIHNLCETFPPNSTVLGGTHGTIGVMEPSGVPYLADRDDRNRYEFGFLLTVWG